MTDHILPESTNACPTSPTTDIQPELPETRLGHVIGACSEDDGVPDIGVSIGLGEGSMLWLGELLKRDGADIGFVFHGPDGKRIVAPIWPNCEWQDVADLLRHHVAPILARLTSTTPTLGDMVDREDWTGGRAWPDMLEAIASYWSEWEEDRAGSGTYLPEELAQDAGEFATGLADHLATLSAAPASPIPTSVNGAGEAITADLLGEVMQEAWGEICTDAGAHPLDMTHGRGTVLFYRPHHWTSLVAMRLSERLVALSPALDNTDDKRTIEILSRALAWHGDPQRMATTREEWQQTIDTAIAWVKANPEPGRVSFSSFTHAPWHHDETIEQYRERMTGSPALDNTAVEGQERTAKAIRSATALAEIVEDVLEWGGAAREHDLQVAYDQLSYDLAALTVQTEKA